MHERTVQRMKEFGIEVILESRIDGEYINQTDGGVVRTVDGREVEADLIVRHDLLSPGWYGRLIDLGGSDSCGALAKRPIRLTSKRPTRLLSIPQVDSPTSTVTSDSLDQSPELPFQT